MHLSAVVHEPMQDGWLVGWSIVEWPCQLLFRNLERKSKCFDYWPLHLKHGLCASLCTATKNWWPFCSEQLQKQIMYQNARIFKRNWFIPTPPAISISNLKKTMKMTWLHKFFGLFFIPANGWGKSAQQLISTVLPFHPLYFPWLQYLGSLSLVAKPHFIIIQRIFKKWHTDKLIMARTPSSHYPNTAHTYPRLGTYCIHLSAYVNVSKGT